MTFDEWKDTEDYRQQIVDNFGNFGYVEAIAETAYNAARKPKQLEAVTIPKQTPITRY